MSNAEPRVVDCLVVGYYDWDFSKFVEMTKAMGLTSGAYRDLRLAYVDHDGRPFRAMDLINHHRRANGASGPHYHNYDFLWPAVAYLVSFLHRHGHSADFVNLPHLEWAEFREKLGAAPRTVAITTTHVITPEPARELVRFIRQHSPTSKIVVGGPYVYNQANTLGESELEECFEYLDADYYIVSREGEGALAALLAALKAGTDLAEVKNLAFRRPRTGRSDEVAVAQRRKLEEWLKSNPDRRETLLSRVRSSGGRAGYERTPSQDEDHDLAKNRIDYDLFPKERVGRFVSLWTSKSCPLACAFCGFPARSGAYRFLPVEVLGRDLDRLHALGVTNLTFVDDTFNVPKARFKELLRFMIERRYHFQWNCFYRCDFGDQEAVDLMREAGCGGVFLGVESGSDEILSRMNKTARRADYLRAIPMLREAGILTHANFIVGFPGETDDTVKESLSLIAEARPHTFRAQLWYCDPMTPIWKDAEKVGLRGQSFNWRHDTMDSNRAADWVDRMFLTVEESTWLPQHSFEQWSILYLESKGVAREAIFEYMRRFNNLIKAQLRGTPELAAAEHDRIAALVRDEIVAKTTAGGPR